MSGLFVWGVPSVGNAATPVTPAQSALSVSGRGATVPFTEYAAVGATNTGTLLAASRTADTLASEASGRQAITLGAGSGQYVEFTLTKPANAVDLHYSVPDTSDGSAYTAPLAVYVNGAHDQDLKLTNKYSWFYGSYPFTNSPGSNPHHFWDDVRTTFSTTLPAGTKVRFAAESGSKATTIDVADFEQVAAKTQPAGSLSAASYGAVPGSSDSTTALQNAINAAGSQGKTLWIPAGTYNVTQHLIVDNVTIQGAGQWFTVLGGKGVGVYGKTSPGSTKVHLSDFAVIGEVTDRDDNAQVNAIGGAIGGGSTLSGLWLQHTKVGMWFDGPFDGLTITGVRILDTTADGVNLHNGISHVTLTQSFVRNTGDDGLAMWSDTNADHDNAFTFNTVVLPMLANNIAVYGGHDNTVSDNVVADTQTEGGGLHVGQRFNSTPLGTTTLARNTTLRAGDLDPNWQFGVGAVWFDARDAAMSGKVSVSDTDILDSSYEAIQFVSGSSITNVSFNDVRIDGTGTFAVQLQVGGSASFTGVTAAHVGGPSGIYNCMGGSQFTLTQGSGNSGWYTANPYCGPWPAPNYVYPGSGDGSTPPPTSPGTCATTGADLARGRTAGASSHTQNYGEGNAFDGDANSYWESANNSFPQWLQVDLGCTAALHRVVVKLPPSSAWAKRTQTLSVLGSSDGAAFTTLKSSAGYTFDPATGNTVTIPVTGDARYLRLNFTANSGWSAGQAAEVQVFDS
ncbi:discoidin domain-containing protein [Streptomyces sp. NPDC059740]|uniref:discoidin domain-containing protein n=1 Tax=Streptomyces sp. NPDC059740 TaxID=3346926 RepID=UPI0036526698